MRLIVRLAQQFEFLARRSDITLSEYRTLAFLQNGPLRAGEIAAAAAVKKPTISPLLAGLRRKGWIAARVDPVDGRVLKVVLTASGRARLRRFDSELADRFEAMTRGADLDRVYATLTELWRILDASVAGYLAAWRQRRRSLQSRRPKPRKGALRLEAGANSWLH